MLIGTKVASEHDQSENFTGPNHVHFSCHCRSVRWAQKYIFVLAEQFLKNSFRKICHLIKIDQW